MVSAKKVRSNLIFNPSPYRMPTLILCVMIKTVIANTVTKVKSAATVN